MILEKGSRPESVEFLSLHPDMGSEIPSGLDAGAVTTKILLKFSKETRRDYTEEGRKCSQERGEFGMN